MGFLTLIGPAQAKQALTEVAGATTIPIDVGAALFDEGVFFVDVWKASDFDAGRIPGAVNLCAHDMTDEAMGSEAAKDDKMVF